MKALPCSSVRARGVIRYSEIARGWAGAVAQVSRPALAIFTAEHCEEDEEEKKK